MPGSKLAIFPRIDFGEILQFSASTRDFNKLQRMCPRPSSTFSPFPFVSPVGFFQTPIIVFLRDLRSVYLFFWWLGLGIIHWRRQFSRFCLSLFLLSG
ncbi:unnamed protein product [Coffea canephora]|uniref:Uncharacterized protein n=1 Tax=Coffea canephora TaxID=49390 RepID=A0A068UIC0_COFCA|nr:unnamed protein product [Coffea canephora]